MQPATNPPEREIGEIVQKLSIIFGPEPTKLMLNDVPGIELSPNGTIAALSNQFHPFSLLKVFTQLSPFVAHKVIEPLVHSLTPTTDNLKPIT